MEFVTAIVQVFTTVLTSFVQPLASAVVNMFTGLFVADGGGLSVLAQGLLAFAAMGLVVGAFYTVFRIFRTRVLRRM